jgi:hypothetical protein
VHNFLFSISPEDRRGIYVIRNQLYLEAFLESLRTHRGAFLIYVAMSHKGFQIPESAPTHASAFEAANGNLPHRVTLTAFILAFDALGQYPMKVVCAYRGAVTLKANNLIMI